MSKFLVLLIAATASAQTMSLDQAIRAAIARSPEIRALNAAVDEARANTAVSDPFRSSASISATPGYATGLPTAVLGQVPAIGTVEAHRLLYDRSARADQLEAATQIDAAIARLESRKREIAQNVAELYAHLGADQVLASSAKKRVTAHETIASHAEELHREGRLRDLDVDRARLQLQGARTRVLQANAKLELDQLRFERMIGVGAAVPAAWPPGTAAATLSAEPELRSLDVRIEALQQAVNFEKGIFHPTIAAQIQYSRLFDRYGRYYLNFKPDDFAIGATVTFPFWTSGRRWARLARLTAQLDQLTAQREARRADIDLAIDEAKTETTQAALERNLAEAAKRVAKESLDVARKLSAEGRGEANDVPLAEIALADAEDELANAAARESIASARLSILRGEVPNK